MRFVPTSALTLICAFTDRYGILCATNENKDLMQSIMQETLLTGKGLIACEDENVTIYIYDVAKYRVVATKVPVSDLKHFALYSK